MPTINDGDVIQLPIHQVARVQIQGQDDAMTTVLLESQRFQSVTEDIFTADPAPISIVSSSVADPSTITTLIDHGLVTGDTIVIAGHSGSTPDINGEHVVTKTGAKTFTIPVNVTGGGTGGSFNCPNQAVLVPVGIGLGNGRLVVNADGDAGPNQALLKVQFGVRVYSALATHLALFYSIVDETKEVPMPDPATVEVALNKVMRLRVEGRDTAERVVELTLQDFVPDNEEKFTVEPTDPVDPYSRLIVPIEAGSRGVTVYADGDPAAPAAIVSSSVANPSVITTTKKHGLTVPVGVNIAGHSGSTPDINGVRTATPTGDYTFTIPVNVSVGGTGGTWERNLIQFSIIVTVVPAVATQLVSSYDLENP